MDEGPSNSKQSKRKSKEFSPKKSKSSPRKWAKGKSKSEKQTESIRVVFKEENNEVIVDVEGIDKEFPIEQITMQ